MILKIFKCSAFNFSYQLKLPRGTSLFPDFVGTGFYSDKTLFIKEVLRQGRFAQYITRPRRWGKSTNLDMLNCFFQPIGWPQYKGHQRQPLDLSRGNQYKVLFCGGGDQNLPPLKIAQATDLTGTSIVEKYQGQYPVIQLNFSTLFEERKEDQVRKFNEMIRSAYQHHKYLYLNLLVDKISDNIQQRWTDVLKIKQWKKKQWIIDNKLNMEKIIIDLNYNYDEIIIMLEEIVFDDENKFKLTYEQLQLVNNFKGNIQNMSQDVANNIELLITKLYKYFNRQVIILIDEFDSPTVQYLEQQINQYISKQSISYKLIENYNEILRNIMIKLTKSTQITTMIEKCIIFGIADIYLRRDSSFNNIKVFPITTPIMVASFAFNDSEINQMIDKLIVQMKTLENINIESEKEKIKKYINLWYNGYDIGGQKLFCPFSVQMYLSDIYENYIERKEIPEPTSYWALSGINMFLMKFGQLKFNPELKKKLATLMETGEVEFGDNKQYEETYPQFVDDVEKNSNLLKYILINAGYITKVSEKKNLYRIPNMEVEGQLKMYLCKVCMQKYFSLSDSLDINNFFYHFFANFDQSGKQFQEFIQNNALPKFIEQNVKEANFQSFFQAVFSFSELFKTHQAIMEYSGSFQKRLDHLFIPIKNSGSIIIHEYKKVLQIQHVAKKETEALWQIYGNCYMHKVLLEYDTSVSQNLIVRVMIFYKDSHSYWKTSIKEIRHTFQQANEITNLFLINGKPLLNIDEEDTSIRREEEEKRKKKLLEEQKVNTIQELIAKYERKLLEKEEESL